MGLIFSGFNINFVFVFLFVFVFNVNILVGLIFNISRTFIPMNSFVL